MRVRKGLFTNDAKKRKRVVLSKTVADIGPKVVKNIKGNIGPLSLFRQPSPEHANERIPNEHFDQFKLVYCLEWFVQSFNCLSYVISRNLYLVNNAQSVK